MDDSEFLLTCHTVCLLKTNKPNLADKLIESHNQVAHIPAIQVSIQYPIAAEFMVKRPYKFTIRVLFLVLLTCAKFLKKRNKRLKLQDARCALTNSILTPANLDSMLPLLPNETINTEDKEFNTKKFLNQPSPEPTQLRRIKSNLYTQCSKPNESIYKAP